MGCHYLSFALHPPSRGHLDEVACLIPSSHWQAVGRICGLVRSPFLHPLNRGVAAAEKAAASDVHSTFRLQNRCCVGQGAENDARSTFRPRNRCCVEQAAVANDAHSIFRRLSRCCVEPGAAENARSTVARSRSFSALARRCRRLMKSRDSMTASWANPSLA